MFIPGSLWFQAIGFIYHLEYYCKKEVNAKSRFNC